MGSPQHSGSGGEAQRPLVSRSSKRARGDISEGYIRRWVERLGGCAEQIAELPQATMDAGEGEFRRTPQLERGGVGPDSGFFYPRAMKIGTFLSSAMTGELDVERNGVATLFESEPYLRDLFELFSIEGHASTREIEQAYLEEVEAADVVIFLFGRELRSAVQKEFERAESTGRRILCYIRNRSDATDELRAFIAQRAYNYHAAHFHDALDLVRRVRADFRRELVRVYKGPAQDIAVAGKGDAYAIRTLRAAFSSTAFFSPADVQEVLARPEYKSRDAAQLIAISMLTLEETGNYLTALLLLEAALMKEPKNWMALANRGMVLMEMGLMGGAQSSFEAALRQRPNEATIHYNLGNCHSASGRMEQALACYEKALECEPGKPSAVSRLATTYLQMGDAANALKWARHSMALEPSHTSSANLALALGMSGQREAALEQVRTIGDDEARAHELRAFIEYHAKQYEACIREVDLYEALAPTSLRPVTLKFDSLINLGRAGAAQAYFIELEERFVLTFADYNDRAFKFQVAFGSSDFVVECYRKSLALEDRYMSVWNNLQAGLGDLGRFGEAIEACDQALAINPFDQKSIQNKVNSLQHLGRWRDAAAVLAEKAAGVVGPHAGKSPEEFRDELLSGPAGQLLGLVEDLANRTRGGESDRS